MSVDKEWSYPDEGIPEEWEPSDYAEEYPHDDDVLIEDEEWSPVWHIESEDNPLWDELIGREPPEPDDLSDIPDYQEEGLEQYPEPYSHEHFI